MIDKAFILKGADYKTAPRSIYFNDGLKKLHCIARQAIKMSDSRRRPV